MFSQKALTPTVTVSSIGTVIAKPTRACNADCSYCCAPAYDNDKWGFEKFKHFFDKMEPHMVQGATWLWHGGEPMLMSPSFYTKAKEYADSKGRKDIAWSMQSNILLYKSSKWKRVFQEVFEGRISTSYEPDEVHRTVKGCPKKYGERFKIAAKAMLDDGFDLFIIGVFDDNNIDSANELYNFAKKNDGRVAIRINYKVPVGRAKADEIVSLLNPKTYGEKLVELEKLREKEQSNVSIIPNDILLEKLRGGIDEICPWTNNCAGRIISIEPNGDVYNCDNYAEIGDKNLSFGNLNYNETSEIFSSKAFSQALSRSYTTHDDCLSCDYFYACRGGCSRDSYLFTGDTNGKFPYCYSWKLIFNELSRKI